MLVFIINVSGFMGIVELFSKMAIVIYAVRIQHMQIEETHRNQKRLKIKGYK